MSSLAGATLITNYRAVSFQGTELLRVFADGDLSEDYLRDGSEPRLSVAHAFDAPDIAGQTHGPLYPRGNKRWQASISRVVMFNGTGTWPLVLAETTDGIPAGTYDDPAALAQKWLDLHLRNLPASGSLSWDGAGLGSGVINAEGFTDEAFAVVTYQITASQSTLS